MRKAIAGSLALAAVALLGLSAQAQLLQKKALTLAAARKMVAAAQPEAERNHWRGVVAVADDGDWLILLGPMDHAAMTASVELAGGQGAQRGALQEAHPGAGGGNQPGSLRGETVRGFIEMRGGLPIVVDGEVIGGIGARYRDLISRNQPWILHDGSSGAPLRKSALGHQRRAR
jgi:glc operon protein GlcG